MWLMSLRWMLGCRVLCKSSVHSAEPSLQCTFIFLRRPHRFKPMVYMVLFFLTIDTVFDKKLLSTRGCACRPRVAGHWSCYSVAVSCLWPFAPASGLSVFILSSYWSSLHIFDSVLIPGIFPIPSAAPSLYLCRAFLVFQFCFRWWAETFKMTLERQPAHKQDLNVF